jgi:hypothetical protein
MVMVMLADDAYLFMVAWETMALSSYFLVTTSHRIAEIRRAGFLYLLIAHIGAIAILLCFGVMHGGGGDYTFDALRASELPVFWACGVTPQAAMTRARPEFCITHAPGAMLTPALLVWQDFQRGSNLHTCSDSNALGHKSGSTQAGSTRAQDRTRTSSASSSTPASCDFSPRAVVFALSNAFQAAAASMEPVSPP